jgi:2-keto-4-pentenoate hydratase
VNSRRIAEAARALADARRNDAPLVHFPETCRPQSAAEAYAIQDAATAMLGGARGWKVGAATPEAEPSCAPILASRIVPAGHRFGAGAFRLNGVEAELAFTFARDLRPRASPYSADDVASAIRSAHAAIEILDSRFVDMAAQDPLSQLADWGNNGALVVGPASTGTVRIDQTQQPVELFVDDASVFSAVGGNTAGDVLRLLAWLANHLAARIGGLRAGDVVTTGSCSGARFLPAGSRVRAVFPGVGACAVVL